MDFHHLVQELWAIEFRGLIHVRLWDFYYRGLLSLSPGLKFGFGMVSDVKKYSEFRPRGLNSVVA